MILKKWYRDIIRAWWPHWTTSCTWEFLTRRFSSCEPPWCLSSWVGTIQRVSMLKANADPCRSMQFQIQSQGFIQYLLNALKVRWFGCLVFETPLFLSLCRVSFADLHSKSFCLRQLVCARRYNIVTFEIRSPVVTFILPSWNFKSMVSHWIALRVLVLLGYNSKICLDPLSCETHLIRARVLAPEIVLMIQSGQTCDLGDEKGPAIPRQGHSLYAHRVAWVDWFEIAGGGNLTHDQTRWDLFLAGPVK